MFVDAGYLMAAASTRVTGTSLRGATDMDVAGLLADIAEQVQADSSLPLLRIHWYDAGTRQGGALPGQREIGMLPRVKLRLGRSGFNGEQKGVDLKLALDLIAHSRNRVSEVAYLISGDDDLSEAVEAAQQLGVQVVALVVPDAAGDAIAVSTNLQITVDRMVRIDGACIDARVNRSAAALSTPFVPAPPPTPLPQPSATPTVPVPRTESDSAPPPARPTPLFVPARQPVEVRPMTRSTPAYVTSTGNGGYYPGSAENDARIEEAISFVVDSVVMSWWRSATPGNRDDLLASRPSIPAEVDRALLTDLSNKLGVYDLPQNTRYALRDAFWETVERL
ncbi:MAG: NYN domain-containing protein [Sporichthyaceae bacterium]